MLYDDLGSPVKHTLEVICLAGILDFDDDQLTLFVFHENIYPVELVVLGFFISFAFKDLLYFKIIKEQLGKEAFQDVEVGFIAEQPLHGPIEAN
jgi:hypothetical protein